MKKLLVIQSDFGLVDGAVAAMIGVCKQVDNLLEIHNLTHDISQFNCWEASYRLQQTIKFWPEGTVFVSVVDPGVGSTRKSVVALTNDGYYIVTPNNGTLTHLSKTTGIKEIREIDEKVNRLEGSQESHTFHGRDVYAYTGARLASCVISFEEVGPSLSSSEIFDLEVNKPISVDNVITGSIDILDVRYGSLWTNINHEFFKEAGFNYGDEFKVELRYKDRIIYNNIVKFGKGFSDVNIGEAIIYVNSVLTIAVAINQGNFSKAYNVKPGQDKVIKFTKIN